MSYHGLNKVRIALYGGLFTNSCVVDRFKDLANDRLGKYGAEIKSFDKSILYNSYKLVKSFD